MSRPAVSHLHPHVGNRVQHSTSAAKAVNGTEVDEPLCVAGENGVPPLLVEPPANGPPPTQAIPLDH